LKTPTRTSSGFTLIEMIMAVGSGAIILSAITVASVALQRSFNAVSNYSINEGDQLRVLDYVAMDCRRSLTASVANNTITLTLPVYYTNPTATSMSVNTPTLSGGAVSYGTGSVTVTYSQSGSNFNREVVIKNSSGTTTSDVTTAIATNVASFTVTGIDLTSSLSCSIMFFPTFRYTTGGGTWRSGSTAPDGSTAGNDGDLYVIDPKASDTTTTGNVYRRTNGTYTLLENIKATTVYCNTFLRNASARQ
jgi:hypothetical protein